MLFVFNLIANLCLEVIKHNILHLIVRSQFLLDIILVILSYFGQCIVKADVELIQPSPLPLRECVDVHILPLSVETQVYFVECYQNDIFSLV